MCSFAGLRCWTIESCHAARPCQMSHQRKKPIAERAIGLCGLCGLELAAGCLREEMSHVTPDARIDDRTGDGVAGDNILRHVPLGC
jgi:hypothetical protein